MDIHLGEYNYMAPNFLLQKLRKKLKYIKIYSNGVKFTIPKDSNLVAEYNDIDNTNIRDLVTIICF